MSARGDNGPRRASWAARRRWLMQTGALAGSAALPLWVPRASAQAQSTLNALPRVALIIGNTNYVDSPLKNPGNDAKAIAGELQKVGFKTNLQLDTGRVQLAESIQAFGADLAKSKGVGLFYYAGHGAQLGWRNYLIPVDADVQKLEDMRTQTVELNILLVGLTKAQNAMNVIILDACRDNPFGSKVPTEHKGLSQFDAPARSLLAYATSPGNTAGDGSGAHGLYTENLLREIKVPEAKIEDVLKRVRLNVRRKSEGQQIPWESTSLEDDFYFLPPRHVQKLSEAEIDKQFNDELAVWEKIKDAKDPGVIEEYLRKNPSGRFSELAQYQLDRILAKLGEKKIQLVVEKDNPFTKGNARIDTQFKVGDSYTYREIDLFTKIESRTVINRIAEITEDQVIFGGGMITDHFGNQIKLPDGRVFTGAQFFIPEYAIGKKWSTRFKVNNPNGLPAENEIEFKVVAREQITVPAGSFDAFRVEGEGWSRNSTSARSVSLKPKYWIAQGIRRPVAREDYRRARSGNIINTRQELTAYVQQ